MTLPSMHTFTRVLIVLAVTTGVLKAEEAFEGVIHYSLKSGKKPLEMVHFIKGNHMRIELPLDGSTTAASLVDLDARMITVLMPDQRMYMTMPIPEAGDIPGNTGTVAIEDTGETVEILGYPCTRYLLKDGERTVNVWATKGLGRYFGSSNPVQKPGSRSIWENQLAEAGLFPLRVVETDRRGKEIFSLDVTKIEQGPVEDVLFALPSGYQKFEMPSMGGMPFGR